ncbi:hypothetical protein ACFPK1_32270 [Actinomycetospora rhizophila]|uniref:Uncharacterized protein n=1 Tax=Actinomycetospora rhizophila TaxID=1416876 RepID=A0ABV9ZRW3_9PSEU
MLLLAGALVLLVVCVALLVLSRAPGSVVALEVSKVLMSLIVAIIVTGYITSTLNRQAQRRSERIARLGALSSALQELKGAYEQMSVARTMLRADLSGRAFEEQLPAILDCRSRLQRIERDRVVALDALTGEHGPISDMVAFTRGVKNVYIANHALIRRSSLLDERRRKRVVDGEEAPDSPAASALDPGQLVDAEFLQVLTAPRPVWRGKTFYLGYVSAKNILEGEILEIRERLG